MITVLAGGVGGARFLNGLVQVVDPAEITVIVNVGDDLDWLGLRVCPDLDTITYTLGGVINPVNQWGRADEQFTVRDELARFTYPDWFTLGDRDLALHLHRTRLLNDGLTLTQVTANITAAYDIAVRLLPATNDPVETRIVTTAGDDLHFQEYWVRDRANAEVATVRLKGALGATPAPGVLDALMHTDAILFAPSNPVVSIGTILTVPQIRDAIKQSSAPVVGVSPIINGHVVRGMADRLLPAVNIDVSAAGVAGLYEGLIDGWVIDTADAALADAIAATGVATIATDTVMDSPTRAAALATRCLELADYVLGQSA
jgi:LPPG:FO 2-phospho-L-lactate transferase